MNCRPLHWRLLDIADRVRSGVGCAAATVVAIVAIGSTALPRRRQPGPEQWMADRRASREQLITNQKQR